MLRNLYFIAGLFTGFILTSVYIDSKNDNSNKVFADTKVINKQDTESLVVNAKIVNIHDGDTVTISITKELNIRLLDCWCPEINSKNKKEKERGLASKAFLESMLKTNDEVTVEIPIYENLGKSITFGRFLGYIWKDVNSDGIKENISKEMVDNNFATKNKVKE